MAKKHKIIKDPNTINVLEDDRQTNHGKDLSSDKLIEALMFFWDGFDRANLQYFLLKSTAEDAINNRNLKGDGIYIGIRQNEWNGGGERIFKGFMEHNEVKPVNKTKDYLEFSYQDVPVYLYIYEDNECLNSFDTIFYHYETFSIPNPYKLFVERYQK